VIAVILALLGSFALAGCATQRYLEVQCLDRPRAEIVEGPVVMDGDDILYYDGRNRLRKASKETCGVRIIE
jgi:hypothetical protein